MKLKRFAVLTYVLAATGIAHAQSPVALVNIPFDFTVLGQTMHAGKYTITESVNTQTVTVQRVDQKAVAIAIAVSVVPAGPKDQGRVVFHQYGDQYFLKGVWIPGSYHSELPESARERELAATRKPLADPVLVTLR